MAPDWRRILILVLWGLQSACFVFNSEEIKSLNFVVDILDQPVILDEVIWDDCWTHAIIIKEMEYLCYCVQSIFVKIQSHLVEICNAFLAI